MELPTDIDQLKEIAAQLRKPVGKPGTEIANMMNVGNSNMNLHTLAVLNPQINQRILEIGMGNGFFVKNILNVDASIQYVGIDYSNQMVKESMELNSKFVLEKRAEFLEGSINDLPFDSNSFDQIFTVNTFYFWDNHEQVITELMRVLKPSGTLILSIRPKHNLDTMAVAEFGFDKKETGKIEAMLSSAGFSTIHTTKIIEPAQGQWGAERKLECHIIQAN